MASEVPMGSDEVAVLGGLNIQVMDQERLEQEVMHKVDEEMEKKDHERRTRLCLRDLHRVASSLKRLKERNAQTRKQLDAAVTSDKRRRSEALLAQQDDQAREKSNLLKDRDTLVKELKELNCVDVENDESLKCLFDEKLDSNDEESEETTPESETILQLQHEETEREKAIRLGQMTAFGKTLVSTKHASEDYKEYIGDQVALAKPDRVSNERQKRGKKRHQPSAPSSSSDDEEYASSSEDERKSRKRRQTVDDGDRDEYLLRLDRWQAEVGGDIAGVAGREAHSEELEGGLRVPGTIWDQLFGYQKVCVQWLWELHQQRVGGILGDEMGLGKTIQVISFLAAMSFSQRRIDGGNKFGPVLIVGPTTVMHQWVKEFHKWWPLFRVAVLHDSGSHQGTRKELIRSIAKSHGILITSYNGVLAHKEELVEQDFHYIILDEGHKIRNPDAQVTLSVKEFHTPHRLILSGSPLQNNLKELWSLFDFIYPGKLGTMPVFMQQFSVPITQGGYSNATRVQVATAYKCATVLRDTINPYLLRRMKSDVKQHINLPEKNEQVLFCRLTDEQRDLYKSYIDSGEIKSILDGRLQVFVGLTNLRKICNHPDLYDGGPRHYGSNNPEEEAVSGESKGYWKRSGKMIVVRALLRLWKQQSHRVLLFTQSRQMLNLLESFVIAEGYSYLKLDGTTSIASRQPLINRFNSSPEIFVFLLTTRVGGLGVNLTGASRVVIFDPDWNPSTDLQARERAWRIGQDKQVTIYRLMTAGTIEEKIYHRQIFKQFLVNRVLKDPRQKRFFKSNDLYELFTLSEGTSDGTETSAIFAGLGSDVEVRKTKRKKRKDKEKEADVPSFKPHKPKPTVSTDVKRSLANILSEDPEPAPLSLSDEKRQKLLAKVRSISKKLSEGSKEKSKDKKVDGSRIPHLVKRRTYRPSNEEDPDEKQKSSQEQDNYVLSKLLKKTGVHSAIRHDAIVDGDNEDYVLIEGEAERVAKEAVESLRRSRRQCHRAEAGVPSWTGNNGSLVAFSKRGKKKAASAATPESKHKPMSASELLSRMKHRNRFLALQDPEGGLFRPDNESSSVSLEQADLLSDLRNFVAFQAQRDGEATTAELMARFSSRVPAKDSPLFRALLNQICTMHKAPMRGESTWKLKPEFA